MDPTALTPAVLEQKRRSALRFLEPLRAAVAPREELWHHIHPHDEDYALAFQAPHADRAREGYKALWESGVLPIRPDNERTGLAVLVVPSEALMVPEGLAYRHFPAGFKKVAATLQPDRWWAMFRYVQPGRAQGGMVHHGLFQIDDERWTWFPKPWRVLASP